MPDAVVRKPVPPAAPADEKPPVPPADEKPPVPRAAPVADAAPPAYGTALEAGAAPAKPPLLARLDALLARRVLRNNTYARLPRVHFFLAVLAAVVVLLILVIVLPVTLTRRGGHAADLPLPSGAQTYTGDGTYYGTGLGSCGITSSDSDFICAIAHSLFDAMGKGITDPNQNPACGRKIRAVRQGRSEGIEVKVVDRCVGCQPTDLDFSPAAFEKLGALAEGRIEIEWAWV